MNSKKLKSLYKLCLDSIVQMESNKFQLANKYKQLPNIIVFDLISQFLDTNVENDGDDDDDDDRNKNQRMPTDLLINELTNIGTMGTLLKLKELRVELIKLFQRVVSNARARPGFQQTNASLSENSNLGYSPNLLVKQLVNNYLKLYDDYMLNGFEQQLQPVIPAAAPPPPLDYPTIKYDLHQIIDIGLNLGDFLNDCGWYMDSCTVLNLVKHIILENKKNVCLNHQLLQTYHILLISEALNCDFVNANTTLECCYNLLNQIRRTDVNDVDVDDDNKHSNQFNLAPIYSSIALLFFARSEYNKAYEYSVKALKHFKGNLSKRCIIDILRLCGKISAHKREFKKANLLLQHALYLTSHYFGDAHALYADCLLDYAFYLLNSDQTKLSVQVYQKAVEIRERIFGLKNLKVAICYEDYAYALYVHNYNTGIFTQARRYSKSAVKIMTMLLPKSHLMLASAQRVKALILEEVAIDLRLPLHMQQNNQLIQLEAQQIRNELLEEAESLHLSALRLCTKSFGEMNIQTAKHFGNLGRLYQTMQQYDKAERMQLKAIEIKSQLLGECDYEVGLSIGHLASLYNYHMQQYRAAEKLYLKTIQISKNIYGDGYSGLEYDYRGLVHVYGELKDYDQMLYYSNQLSNWVELRERQQLTNRQECYCRFEPPTPLQLPIPFFLDNSYQATNHHHHHHQNDNEQEQQQGLFMNGGCCSINTTKYLLDFNTIHLIYNWFTQL